MNMDMNYSADRLKKNLDYHLNSISLNQPGISSEITISNRQYQKLLYGQVNIGYMRYESVVKIENYFKTPFKTLLTYGTWILEYNLGHIVASLEDFPETLENLIAKIPEEKLSSKEKERNKSIADHLLNLIDEQMMFYKEIRLFKTKESPGVDRKPWVGRAKKLTEPVRTGPELAESFTEWRVKQLILLAQLHDRDFKKKGIQPGNKDYSMQDVIINMMSRDYYHYYIIFESSELKLDLNIKK